MLIHVYLFKSNKVQISWEGQKVLKKSPTLLWTYQVIKKVRDFSNFVAFSQYLNFINCPLCKSGRRGNMVAKKKSCNKCFVQAFLIPPLPMLVQIHYIHSAKRFSNWNKRALRNKELKCLLFPPSPNKPSRSMSSLSCWILKLI